MSDMINRLAQLMSIKNGMENQKYRQQTQARLMEQFEMQRRAALAEQEQMGRLTNFRQQHLPAIRSIMAQEPDTNRALQSLRRYIADQAPNAPADEYERIVGLVKGATHQPESGLQEVKSGDELYTFPTTDGRLGKEPIAVADRWSPNGGTTINMGEKLDPSLEYLSKGLGQEWAPKISAVPDQYKAIERLSRMEQAVDKLDTGKAAGLKKMVRGIADDLGLPVDIEQLSEAEALEAMGNELALIYRNPDSGYGLTGNTSDKDLKFLMSLPPGLSKSNEGNKLLITYLKKLHRHQINVAREVERYAEKNGTLLGIANHLGQWAEDNPVFTEKDVSRATKLTGEAPKIVERRTHRTAGELVKLDNGSVMTLEEYEATYGR